MRLLSHPGHCLPLSPLTTEQMVTAVNGVAGGTKLERGSSSSDQEESLCQEDIQKLLGLQQSKVSLDKVSSISLFIFLTLKLPKMLMDTF